MADLSRVLQVVLDFAATLGIETQRLQSAESSDYLRLTLPSLDATGTRRLEVAKLEVLMEVLGDSLSATWKIGDLEMLELSASSSLLSSKLDQFRSSCSDHTLVDFEFEIDKTKLISHLQIPSVPRRISTLFLFTSAFERLLTDAVTEPMQLETALWRGRDSGLGVVLLADQSILVTGTLLNVVGYSELGSLELIGGATEKALEHVQNVFESCREAIRWEKPWLTFITPEHLRLKSEAHSNNRVVQLLAAVAFNVSLLYTADRVRCSDQQLIGLYAAENYQCEIAGLVAENISEDFKSESAFSIAKLACWAYEERWQSDRIRLIQVTFARTFTRGTQPRTSKDVLESSSLLDSEVRWHWKAFVSDAVGRYIKEESDLENEVAETIDNFENQVSAMISSLSGTMLAAVGVLIGSFIAAAFKDKFNTSVFVIGVSAYMVYLGFFPGIYNMLHHHIRFQSMKRIFEKRKSRFTKLLGAEATDRIIDGQIEGAEKRFSLWFGFTIVALVFVLVLAAIAIHLVPQVFSSPIAAP